MNNTSHDLKHSYAKKRSAIRDRLGDFKKVIAQADDNKIFEVSDR